MDLADRIKAQVSLLDHFKATSPYTKETRRNGYVIFNPCPFCGHKDCFSIKADDNYFKCFSCNKKGTAIDYEIARQETSAGEAMKSLAERYSIETEAMPRLSKTARKKATKKPGSPGSPDKGEISAERAGAAGEQQDLFPSPVPSISQMIQKAHAITKAECQEYLTYREFGKLSDAAEYLIVDQGLRVAKVSGVHCLLVPLFAAPDVAKESVSSSDVIGVQRITINGANLPGLSVNKAFPKGTKGKGVFSFMTRSHEVFVVESFANALAIAAAGYSAVSIFSTSNLDQVAEIKRALPKNKIILWLDRGVEEKQVACCREHTLDGIWWPEEAENGYDVNDLLTADPDGFAARIRRELERASAVPPWWSEEHEKQLPAKKDDRPEIVVEGGELHTMVDQAEQILLDTAGLDHIFQRFGRLVCVSQSQINEKTVCSIRQTEKSHLVELLTRLIQWKKWDGRLEAYRRIDCPKAVAEAYLARPKWGLRNLTGIITAPALRRDGSILDQPGYDEQTGLLFVKTFDFPPIPKEPNKEEIVSAMKSFNPICRDFPFESIVDGSVFLSAIFTSLIRFSLRTAPLHGFSAPKMGSGKSLLADAVALIATGRPASVISQSDNSEEEKKRLLALLMEAERVVCIDNIERPLESAALCSILTQETWKERILGTNVTAEVATNSTTWLATGNNLMIRGDLSTRSLVSRLAPQCERPEEREFEINLHKYIPEHRGELISAGLTLLRAYHLAGRTCKLKPFGRFEEWSEWVRGTIVSHGLADPCESRKSVEESDPYREILIRLMETWHDKLGDRQVAGKEIISAAGEHGEKSEALALALQEFATNKKGDLDARRLGEFLKRNQGRIEGGHKIVPGEKTKLGKLWQVVRTGAQ